MAYTPPQLEKPITLSLSRNESQPAIDNLSRQLQILSPEFIGRYPDHLALQNLIGQSLGIDAERIVVSAGGDDAIDRILRGSINPQRKKIVTHRPTFEMIEVYARNYGGVLDEVAWMEGQFPLDAILEKIDQQTATVVVVTPNNPTGGVISLNAVLAIADAARKFGVQLLVDHAYVEFADEDPTETLAGHGNINLVRTLSKAWGLAGLRVGYLIAAHREVAARMRSLAGPFPVSAVSLELARRALSHDRVLMEANVRQIMQNRSLLIELLKECGARPLPSQGNFVLAQFTSGEQAHLVWKELANDGIGVRKFAGPLELEGCLRITVPMAVGDYLALAKSLCRQFQLDWDCQKNLLGVSLLDQSRTSTGSTSAIDGEEKKSTASASCAEQVGRATVHRQTKETKIDLALSLYGTGQAEISTGIGFLDHMLTALTFHSRMDLTLKCIGDLEVDDHHTAEDCALALGSAIDQALEKRTGIQRFGYAFAPLDEALARTVIDLSARPWPEVNLQLQREMVGNWACENMVHFFQSLAMSLRCSLHVDVLRGQNDHHRVEAAFKSLALALRQALTKTAGLVPSTKGVL
jgi:histidinol-phosphate aminotransferase